MRENSKHQNMEQGLRQLGRHFICLFTNGKNPEKTPCPGYLGFGALALFMGSKYSEQQFLPSKT